MPTNQEFLTQLATESPDKLKAWFDAEHNDTLTAEKVVSGDSTHSNDGNAHLKDSDNLSDAFSDSREKLEADVREWVDDIGWLSDKETQVADFIAWLDRQAGITERETKLRELYRFEENHREHIRSIEEVNQQLNERIRQLEQFIQANKDDAEQAFRDYETLQQQVDKLTAERDNLAKDLNDMMRSMDKLCDRFRDASSSALDNAHEIQRIIDNFWTV